MIYPLTLVRKRTVMATTIHPPAYPRLLSLSRFSHIFRPFCLVRFHSFLPLFLLFPTRARPPARKLKCSVRFLRALRLGHSLGESACFADNVCKYEVARISDFYTPCSAFEYFDISGSLNINRFLFALRFTFCSMLINKISFKKLEYIRHIRYHVLRTKIHIWSKIFKSR